APSDTKVTMKAGRKRSTSGTLRSPTDAPLRSSRLIASRRPDSTGAERWSKQPSISAIDGGPVSGARGRGGRVATPSKSVRASRTPRPNIPQCSSDQVTRSAPSRLTRPNVGFSPATPQSAAGRRTEPPASVPMEASTAPEPTVAPDPPLDPLAVRVGSTGLLLRPVSVDGPNAAPPGSP